MANPRSQFSDKSRLRDTLRDRLKQMSPLERQRRSRRICKRLLPLLLGKNSLALFAPTSTEPDLDLLWEVGLTEHHFVSYPRCEDNSLSFHLVSTLSELVPGRFGIREPIPGRSPEQLDLILVPGLAFTKEGQRLGRGAGFYDRFLSTIPATTLKVGVCFEFQRISDLPFEPHDVEMDVLVWG